MAKEKNRKIEIEILGDSASTDPQGKCVSYRVSAGGKNFILDCGSPVLAQTGAEAFSRVSGVLVSHCHEDHVRWLAELAIYNRFYLGGEKRLPVYATEDVHRDIRRFMEVFIGRSLTFDREKVAEFTYESFIEPRVLGFTAKYRIEKTGRALRVVDSRGRAVPPGRAKVVVSPDTGRARMLFRESENGRWVDPECFFAFGDPEFYVRGESVLKITGGVIRAVKDHSWHGMLTSGFDVRCGKTRVFFTSDTVFSPELWKKLAAEIRPQKFTVSRRRFSGARVLEAEINDLIEQTWSEKRLAAALALYDGADAIFHDVNTRESVIHTGYEALAGSKMKNLVLVHAPEYFVTREILARPAQVFVVAGGKIAEKIGRRLDYAKPDIFIRDSGRFYIGFENAKGAHEIYRSGNLLKHRPAKKSGRGKNLMRVKLYEVVGNSYVAPLKDGRQRYILRPDGGVSKITFARGRATAVNVPSLRR